MRKCPLLLLLLSPTKLSGLLCSFGEKGRGGGTGVD
jgi:hypothetical protein